MSRFSWIWFAPFALVTLGVTENPARAAVETVVVTAEKLAEARNTIQTQTGASTYTITNDQIQAQPGGDNLQLNNIILQMPGVTQDSYGQIHVRAEHAEIQYRLNGVIIPEGIAVFGQTLNPRLADQLKLIDGALPAEYGLRTAAVIDIQTKTGLIGPGGDLSVYGGSHSEITPSADYRGSFGNFNYFVSGDYVTDTLGIESPDGSTDPLHDRTKQWHGFAFGQEILDDRSSLTAILGTSNAMFQIPNVHGLEPSGISGVVGLGPCGSGTTFYSPGLGRAPNCNGSDTEVLVDRGQFVFPSERLDENQREITHFGILSYLFTQGLLNFQVSVFGRYSSLFFTPDAVGDVLFKGIAQTAYKRDVAYGSQAEASYRPFSGHTVRAGLLYQADDLISRTSALVFPLAADASGAPGNTNCPLPGSQPDLSCQITDAPSLIPDNGSKHAWSYSFYLQDEWKISETLTINYGIRWDEFGAFDHEGQLSPRINAVWMPLPDTTVHLGYSRYFTPPPIELVATTDIAIFNGTTAAAGNTTDTTPRAERADYYDFGVLQNISGGFAVGFDSFYKLSRNLIDEGQFGAPIIFTPFNYARGRQYGLELTGTFANGPLNAYLNAAYERGVGEHIVSSEFNFNPDDLAYIATHFIPLDHQQLGTVTGGASYLWKGTRLSMDLLFGTGLRSDGVTPNGAHVPAYTTVNLGVSHKFEFGALGDLTARFDIINVFDRTYEIRDGTGVGVGAPQWGARRGYFVGLSKSL